MFDTWRFLLITGSLVTIVFMLARIRSSKIAIKDSIFWILFATALLVISVFPELTFHISSALNIMSPINFVYLFVIFILVLKIFTSSLRISMLDTRLQQLTQRMALYEKRAEEKANDRDLKK